MKKLSYLARLRLAARWMLPPKDANEVIADYTDLLEGDERTDEMLAQDFGRPWKAVEMLRQPKPYKQWLIVFCVLAFSVLLLASWVYPILSIQWIHYSYTFTDDILPAFLSATAYFLALIWFFPNGAKQKRLSLALPILLVVLVILGVLVWAAAAFVFSQKFIDTFSGLDPEQSREIVRQIDWWSIKFPARCAPLLALAGLVLARLSDRRWRAVYILGLTVLLLATMMYLILTSISLDPVPLEHWWVVHGVRMGILTLLGLIGTGVSLC